MNERILKGKQGITLVALLITIIILLILAGIAIASLSGQNGLIARARESSEKTRKAETFEKVSIEVLSSFDENGDLNIDTLKENLKKNLKLSESDIQNDVNTGGIKVRVNGFYINVTNIGKVTIDGESIDESIDVSDVDLTGKTSVWLGDSLMAGVEGYNFALNFADSTNSTCYNISFGGTTISDNTPNNSNGHAMTLISQVDYAIESKQYIGEPDFIVLNGGGNDVLLYDQGQNAELKKEVGTLETTTSKSNTVIADYVKCINKLKEAFPNTKILYVQPLGCDVKQFQEMIMGNMFEETSLEDLNNVFGTSFDNKEDVKNYFLTINENRVNELYTRMQDILTEIKKANAQLGVEYLDLENYIIANRDANGENSYVLYDGMHLSQEGYNALTPYIIQKVKLMFK